MLCFTAAVFDTYTRAPFVLLQVQIPACLKFKIAWVDVLKVKTEKQTVFIELKVNN